MFFASPYFLFALVFAGIPLLLHLITKKQIKVIKFSSLLFIKKALQKESKKIKIKELLLLIIRTLIIIFLILSCAKPVLFYDKGYKFVSGTEGDKSIVIILDNSYSTGVISEGESLFKKSKRIALNILDKIIKENDNISLILSSDINRVKFYDLTYEKNEVVELIKEAKIAYVNNSIFESILDAKRILDQSGNSQRIIYLITDMQKINFIKNNSYIYPYIKMDYPLFIIKNSAENIKNSAVLDNKIPMKLNFKNDSVSIYPMVKNYSIVQNNLILKTIINKEAVNQKSLVLKPDEKKAIDARYVISSTGYLGGFTEIADGDDLFFDNRNYFVLYVPSQIGINIIDKYDEMFYVLNSINPAYVLNKNIKSYININEQKSVLNVKNKDILMISYDTMNSSEIRRLKQLVYNSSVLIFPSKNFNINNFNSALSKTRLIEGLVLQQNENRDKPFTIEFVDYSHPVFDLFKEIKIFKNVKVFKYYKIKLDNLSVNTRIIARFSNGDPAIIEYQPVFRDDENKSKIIFFTFMPNIKSSDFVYNPNFPPLIHQTIKYLVNKAEEDYLNKFKTGQTVDDVCSLLDYKKAEIKPVLSDNENCIIDNIIVQPGVYKVNNKYIAVNVDYEESDLKSISIDDVKKNYKGLSILSAENKEEINRKLFSSQTSKPLWKLFLILAFLFLIAELIIANDLYDYNKSIIIFLKKINLYNIIKK